MASAPVQLGADPQLGHASQSVGHSRQLSTAPSHTRSPHSGSDGGALVLVLVPEGSLPPQLESIAPRTTTKPMRMARIEPPPPSVLEFLVRAAEVSLAGAPPGGRTMTVSRHHSCGRANAT